MLPALKYSPLRKEAYELSNPTLPGALKFMFERVTHASGDQPVRPPWHQRVIIYTLMYVIAFYLLQRAKALATCDFRVVTRSEQESGSATSLITSPPQSHAKQLDNETMIEPWWNIQNETIMPLYTWSGNYTYPLGWGILPSTPPRVSAQVICIGQIQMYYAIYQLPVQNSANSPG